MSPSIYFFFNGNIITMDESLSIVDSFAVLDEKIIALGKKTEVANLLANTCLSYSITEVDLDGKTVVPGFIDSHMHPIMAIYYKTQLQLSDISSYKELKETFNNVIPTKKSDEWILGLDFLEENFLDPNERRFPTIKDLDKITKTHPIVIVRHDGHSCFTNSKGLEILGITKETVSDFVVDTGRIELDSNGSPTGVFTEGATSILLDKVPTPSFDSFISAGLEFSNEMASLGITTLGAVVQTTEEGPSGKTGAFELSIMEMLIRENVLKQDYVLYLITDKPKKLIRYKKNIQKLDQGNQQFVVGGIKRFFDGSIGSRTAFLSKPFSDGPSNNYGFLVHSKEKLYEQLNTAAELGFQLICHAIGDKAIEVLIDMYKKIKHETDEKFHQVIMRIEHASILTESLLREIAENDIIIVSQPAFIESEYFWLESRLGKERCRYTYPFKSIIEKGITLAAASDSPVENPSVLNAIETSMHRYGFIPEEYLSIQQALKIFTINAAIALGQDSVKGSLESGKFADFVVLKDNILKVYTKEIKNIEIYETYRRGKKIYKKK